MLQGIRCALQPPVTDIKSDVGFTSCILCAMKEQGTMWLLNLNQLFWTCKSWIFFLKCHRPKHSFAILKRLLTLLITMFIFNLSQAAYWKVPSNSVSVGHHTGPPFHPSHHLSCLTRDCNIRVCQYLGSRKCCLQRTQFWFHWGQICIAIFSLNSQIYSSCTWG